MLQLRSSASFAAARRKVRVQFLDRETQQFVKNWQEHGLQYADDVLQGHVMEVADAAPVCFRQGNFAARITTRPIRKRL